MRQKSSKECYVKAITARNKRKPVGPAGSGSYGNEQGRTKIHKTEGENEGGMEEKDK